MPLVGSRQGVLATSSCAPSAYAIFATSLNLLVGYGGMVSFGHGLFFGLGAYSFALLMQKSGTSRFRWRSLLTIVITAAWSRR